MNIYPNPNVDKLKKQEAEFALAMHVNRKAGIKTAVQLSTEAKAAERRRVAIRRRQNAEAERKAELLREEAALSPALKKWTFSYLRAVAKSVGISGTGGRAFNQKLADHFGIELIPESEIGGQKHVALQLALDLEAISGVRSWRPNSYIPFGVKASQK